MPAGLETDDVAQPIKRRSRRIIERYNAMKREKSFWLNLWQLMGEYIMIRKQNFNNTQTPGESEVSHLFDDTAVNANAIMAAALIGALWPNGAQSFEITMPFGMAEELGDETQEVRDFYDRCTKRMAESMDNPKAGFQTALEEYMVDQGPFGISGIHSEEQDDYEIPVYYRSVDAKIMCVDEGKNAQINTIYVERQYSVRQMVEEYGFENISKQHQKEYSEGVCTSKIKVLQAIEPRMERDPYGFGVQNMPFASIHIDLTTEKILRESGYAELPVAVARFWKAQGEKYGRSPGMNAISSILEANALGEAWTLAIEKTLDPALLVQDDGTMGNGKIDTSPGAIVVVSTSGRIQQSGGKPIEPLFLVGDLQWTAARRTELTEIIKNHFFNDRLMDLNNEQRMQNPEVAIRNELRGQTLNTVYIRQMTELFTPLIERTFAIHLRKGLFGVVKGSREEQAIIEDGGFPTYIPDAVLKRLQKGHDVYKIKFISPATRIMKAEELNGLTQTITFAAQAAPVFPDMLDNINPDEVIRLFGDLTGAPKKAIYAMETVKKMRAAKQKAQAQAAQMQAQQMQADTAAKAGQATASFAQASTQGQNGGNSAA
jgi:hypothetical protein